MEACQTLNSDTTNELKHYQLTPLRLLRGLACLIVYLSTAFMCMVYFSPVIAVFLRLFSLHYSRKIASFLFGLWLAMWPFLFEKINKTKVIFSGEHVPEGERRVLLIANHRTEVDWMYLWDLALRKGCIAYIKYVLKRSLMKLPIFGWAFHVFEFISVERKWEVDETIMRNSLSTFTDPVDPLWLAVFPEGTDFTEQKCIKSQDFAAENDLPILKNVLLPKTRGFYACVESLRGSLDAVYDVTIAYKNRCPTFLDNVFGVEPSEVHVHVRRISIEDIPVSESECSTWLLDTFYLKDQLLSDFIAQGHFPNEGTEGDLSTIKCVVNCIAVMAITSIFVYLTFFSSVWFKVYVVLSCAYLSWATAYSYRPTPIFEHIKGLLSGKKSS
uniref:probable 1-acyl-sn-glycerol-3-phosphate acyltransferase 4 n=1 Tax=Erigeron canadensis TaxID=72917 RepID=UPI001CB890EF|nr:probable 1-acyl-sn-glycerol-3-phosphate acyltransferase 4 [Erigeron canadensis]